MQVVHTKFSPQVHSYSVSKNEISIEGIFLNQQHNILFMTII